MGKREENANTTRQQLLEAAEARIRANGYEQVSVEEITQVAGAAKGTFYNYFKKKDDLIRALYQRRFQGLNDRIPLLAETDAQTSIRAYLEGFAAIIETAGVMQARAWVRYMLLPQEGQSKWEDDSAALSGLLCALRESGRLTSDVPAVALAEMLMTHVYGIVFLWTIHPARTPLAQVQDFCTRYLPSLLDPFLAAGDAMN